MPVQQQHSNGLAKQLIVLTLCGGLGLGSYDHAACLIRRTETGSTSSAPPDSRHSKASSLS
jgi:hypothetical protein